MTRHLPWMRCRSLAVRSLAAGILAAASACSASPPPPATLTAPLAVAPVDAPAERCADAGEPCTWIERLDDPHTRASAILGLARAWEDRMKLDGGDRRGPNVGRLVDLAVEPLTRHCVAGDVGDRARGPLVELLSDMRDARATPCLQKTLERYVVDGTEDDVGHACRAIAALKPAGVSEALFDVFTRIHASHPRAEGAAKGVHDALLAVADAAWEPRLIALVDRPDDATDRDAGFDEAFWQGTAIELLGKQKSVAAVRPLLRVLLTHAKFFHHNDAVLALLRIGKPAMGPAAALLRGEDKELVAFSTAEELAGVNGHRASLQGEGTSHIAVAAVVLGTLGREDAGALLVDALRKTKDPVAAAYIARELAKVPRSKATLQAFQETYEKVPVGSTIPYRMDFARGELLSKAPRFFDKSLVPWIAASVGRMNGGELGSHEIRERALSSTLLLATRDQRRYIDAVARPKPGEAPVGDWFAEEIALDKELLDLCGDRLDCYLGVLTDPLWNSSARHYAGMKAVYQIGLLGTPGVRGKILEAWPRITNAAMRLIALDVIDAFSPHGDPGIAKQLRKMVDDAVASGDEAQMFANDWLTRLIHRLDARAEP